MKFVTLEELERIAEEAGDEGGFSMSIVDPEKRDKDRRPFAVIVMGEYAYAVRMEPEEGE